MCDDVYNILSFGEKPLHSRLMAYDVRTDANYAGNVISNGSFSKIIGPGVRLGWLEVSPRLKPPLERSGFIRGGGCFNNYTASIVASLFELQLAQSHIERLYKAYKERMLATIQILKTELPEGCSFLAPSGGYFIWISLPIQLDSSEFLKYSREQVKISFIPGPQFAIEDGKGKNHFRLSIAFHGKEKLETGVRRLCLGLKEFIKINIVDGK